MVKNKSGEPVLCKGCKSPNVSIYSKNDVFVWIECAECGRIFPVFPKGFLDWKNKS